MSDLLPDSYLGGSAVESKLCLTVSAFSLGCRLHTLSLLYFHMFFLAKSVQPALITALIPGKNPYTNRKLETK